MTHFAVSDLVGLLKKMSASAFEDHIAMHRFVQHHPVEARSLDPYLTWDQQHYTRNLIDRTPLYEFIAICWEIGQGSSIHNHKDQNCWMSVPIGKLQVQNYRVVKQDLKAGTCHIEPTEIISMGPRHPTVVDPRAPVHRVYNPTEFKQRAVSLHLYSRPIDSCVVYSEEQGKCGWIDLTYTTEYGRKPARA